MTMPKLTKPRLLGFALALLIYALDQWSKRYVVNTLGLDRVGENLPLLPFFDLTRTNNFGVSLGMFEATSMEMRWALVLVTGLISCGVAVWILREVNKWDITALSMVLGGALGNIHDRWTLGYVVDFADFHIGTFRPFLIFNLADAAITVGVVILLARALFIGEKSAIEQSEPATGPESGSKPESE